ncbi:MAG: helix-turn-helix domain-containing protein [Ottowia sp.]|nr:helix-turn-helix domain-containing protein [Ottowia sp.]
MSRNFDIEKVAAAIEADMGEALPDLRQALAEVQRGPDVRARTSTPAQILLRRTRAQLGLTQAQFARRIATPTATLRDWEQGRFVPPGGILCLLRLLCTHPELASELPAAA